MRKASTRSRKVAAPIDAEQDETLRKVHASYNMSKHFTYGSPQSQAMDADMIDRFGIGGPPSYCIERITELAEIGITKIFVMDAGQGIDPTAVKQSRRMLVEDVIPALR